MSAISSWNLAPIHQIDGPKAVLKNVMGVVKDLSHVIWTGQSFETINKGILARQPLIRKNIKELEDICRSNERTRNFLVEIEDVATFDLSESIRVLRKQQIDWKLHYLSIPVPDCNFPDNQMGHYEKLYQEVKLQIQVKLDHLRREQAFLELAKCVPLDERLNRIANGLLTTSLSAGAMYYVYSQAFTSES